MPVVMPSVATDMLMDGYDSPALREVARLSTREIRATFATAFGKRLLS